MRAHALVSSIVAQTIKIKKKNINCYFLCGERARIQKNTID